MLNGDTMRVASLRMALGARSEKRGKRKVESGHDGMRYTCGGGSGGA